MDRIPLQCYLHLEASCHIRRPDSFDPNPDFVGFIWLYGKTTVVIPVPVQNSIFKVIPAISVRQGQVQVHRQCSFKIQLAFKSGNVIRKSFRITARRIAVRNRHQCRRAGYVRQIICFIVKDNLRVMAILKQRAINRVMLGWNISAGELFFRNAPDRVFFAPDRHTVLLKGDGDPV